jgi:hypothetical protein
MKIAIMQPYFFPYIGYFQLIAAVDKFIIYDDVNYIKQGWINSNNILLNKKPFTFTIPLKKASSFKKINETEINPELFKNWRDKFLKTLYLAYNSSPNFLIVSSMIENLLLKDYTYINELNTAAIIDVCALCKIETKIVQTSCVYSNGNLKSQARVLDICKQEKATSYINPTGGMMLYDKDVFKAEKIKLQFLNSLDINYKQKNDEFVRNLSIIDLLMYEDHNQINSLLNQYKLI